MLKEILPARPGNLFDFCSCLFKRFCYIKSLCCASHAIHILYRLFRFLMQGMLPAESAVFAHFHSIRIVLFVLHGIIVPLFAFAASKCYFNSHIYTSQRPGTDYKFHLVTRELCKHPPLYRKLHLPVQ